MSELLYSLSNIMLYYFILFVQGYFVLLQSVIFIFDFLYL